MILRWILIFINDFAEAIATYALVFFGPLAIILSVVAFGDGLSIESSIMIALAHGAAVGPFVKRGKYNTSTRKDRSTPICTYWFKFLNYSSCASGLLAR